MSKIVLLVSPFTASTRKDLARNKAYATAAMRDALARGETPIASHVLFGFSGALDNADPSERARGIQAGVELAGACKSVVAYVDYGTTDGMRTQIEALRSRLGAPELRMVEGWRWPQGAVAAADSSDQPAS